MLKYFIGHVALIALTAPWIFLAAPDTSVAGLPLWALYTVGASAVYAVFVAVSYAKLWDQAASREDEQG